MVVLKEEMVMDAAALIKLLVMSLAVVGLARLFVLVFIGDAERGPTIGKWVHEMRAGTRSRP
jgi:hypothetical protein